MTEKLESQIRFLSDVIVKQEKFWAERMRATERRSRPALTVAFMLGVLFGLLVGALLSCVTF